MVRVLELLVGVCLLVPSVWAFCNPREDFRIAARLGLVGVRDRERLELTSWGVFRNRLGYLLLVLTALFAIVDSFLLILPS